MNEMIIVLFILVIRLKLCYSCGKKLNQVRRNIMVPSNKLEVERERRAKERKGEGIKTQQAFLMGVKQAGVHLVYCLKESLRVLYAIRHVIGRKEKLSTKSINNTVTGINQMPRQPLRRHLQVNLLVSSNLKSILSNSINTNLHIKLNFIKKRSYNKKYSGLFSTRTWRILSDWKN